MTKSEILFSHANNNELEKLLEVEKKTWPPEQQFSKDNFINQLKTYPEGMITAYFDNEMVGMFILNRINYDELTDKSWNGTSDYGNLKGVFRSNGKDIYGVSLTVIPESRHMGVGGKLVKEAVKFAKKSGAKSFYLGSRMPKYHENSGMNPEDYMNSDIDPLIYFYKKNGLKIIKLLKDYFDDPESLDYGVLMGVNFET